jgi:hypothetical protein
LQNCKIAKKLIYDFLAFNFFKFYKKIDHANRLSFIQFSHQSDHEFERLMYHKTDAENLMVLECNKIKYNTIFLNLITFSKISASILIFSLMSLDNPAKFFSL